MMKVDEARLYSTDFMIVSSNLKQGIRVTNFQKGGSAGGLGVESYEGWESLESDDNQVFDSFGQKAV